MTKTDEILSKAAKKYLEQYVNNRASFMKYANPIKAYFYSNTKHREYKSRFIESVIMKLLRDVGADPINSVDKGRYIDTSFKYKDVIGFEHEVKQGKFIRNVKVQKGRADIVCFFKGIQYNFEVKVGRDRQSEAQKQEQARAEQNGEKYIIIKTVDDFLNIYDINWREI